MAPDPVFGIGLCAGGCGLELGLEIAIPGYRSACLVERETAVAARMAARMQEGSLPRSLIWDDVGTFDGRPFRGLVSIVSAGFPCQPFSVAGKRKGTGDERWIWPDIKRIIKEVAPESVFLENVPGLLLDPDGDFDRWEMEIESDDAIGGMGTVLRDLAELRFHAEWGCVRAADVGASHGRKRVFILAYRERARLDGRTWAGILGNGSPLQAARFSDGNGRVVNAERTERWPGAIGSGCNRPGFDGEGEASSRFGNGKPVLADSEHSGPSCSGSAPGSSTTATEPSRSVELLADSASSGPSIRRNDLGIRERAAVERTGSELGDSESGRFRELREREPSRSIGQPDGADVHVAHAARDWEYGRDGEAGRGRGRGVRASGEQLDDAFGGGLEGADVHLRSTRPDETAVSAGRSGDGISLFAPGPSDSRWENLLVQRPWLRPSWSQAEAESYFRNLVDGLAPLVAAERTGALRTLGNGVVPLQAAYGFILLAKRAGLI